MTNPPVTLSFWEGVSAAKEAQRELRKTDPARWKRDIDEFPTKQLSLDHHIEHWVCEYLEGN
jgi:hypothetical protein